MPKKIDEAENEMIEDEDYDETKEMRDSLQKAIITLNKLKHSDVESVEALLEKADISVQREDQSRILYPIFTRDNTRLLNQFLEKMKANNPKFEINDLYPLAIIRKNEIAPFHETNPAKTTKLSLLHTAAITKAENIAAFLLNQEGIDVNRLDEKNFTPLHRSISNHDDRISKMLLDAGARIDLRGDLEFSMIYAAFANSSPEVIHKMLRSNNLNVGKLLLEKISRTLVGETPFSFVIKNRRCDIFGIIFESLKLSSDGFSQDLARIIEKTVGLIKKTEEREIPKDVANFVGEFDSALKKDEDFKDAVIKICSL